MRSYIIEYNNTKKCTPRYVFRHEIQNDVIDIVDAAKVDSPHCNASICC